MIRYFIVFVALSVSPVVLSGENEAQQEDRSLSPEYAKAHRRFERACSKLDQENVAQLQRRAERLHKDGWKKGAIRRDGREWCKERGILQDYQGCVGKIANLLFTPQYPEPPQPRMNLAELDPTTRKYIEAIKKGKQRRVQKQLWKLEAARNRLAALTRARVRKNPGWSRYTKWTKDGRTYYESRESLKAAKQSARKEVKRQEIDLAGTKLGTFYPALEMRVGSIGDMKRVRVFQILSVSEMHVETPGPQPVMTGMALQISPSRTYIGPIGRSSAPQVHWQSGGVMFCVKGYSTASLVSGGIISLSGVFEITGTKTYTTAIGGSNTVFVAKPAAIDFDAVSKWSQQNSQP